MMKLDLSFFPFMVITFCPLKEVWLQNPWTYSPVFFQKLYGFSFYVEVYGPVQFKLVYNMKLEVKFPLFPIWIFTWSILFKAI